MATSLNPQDNLNPERIMAERKMEDETMYTDDQDVVTLSPILDNDHAPQFHYGSFSGEVPADPMGFLIGESKGDKRGKK